MLANRIKFLRLSKGLSQVQLAERVGVKKQTVSNWENGNVVPGVAMVEKLADLFRVSTDYLLGREAAEIDGPTAIDVTGLTPDQVAHIRLIIDDLRERKE